MGVPKGKTSKANKRTRRAADKITLPGLSKCPQCHSIKKPHQACPVCGFYKGQEVIKKTAAN